ncbi:unnamed protein product, partial [Mesorhabditis spiculigera]
MNWPFLLNSIALASAATLLGANKKIGDEANDEMFQNFAHQAIREYNQQSNDLFKWDFVRIDDSHKQLVNGERYTLNLVLGQSDCRKTGNDIQRTDCRLTAREKKCVAKPLICEEPILHKADELKTHNTKKNFFKAAHLQNERAFMTTDGGRVAVTAHIKRSDFAAWNMFADYSENYDRSYKDKHTVLQRFRNFKRNLAYAKNLQKREHGTAVYGVTKYSDMTRKEFAKVYLPKIWGEPAKPNKKVDIEDYGVTLEDLPESIDWRDKGAVTGVKNQASCGSCWAFSTTGNVEGQWYLAKGKLVSLSEQELVDCDGLDQGCNGGLPSNAYKEIMRMGGLESEDDYPYSGRQEGTCKIIKKDLRVYINDSVEIPHDEVQMQAWLAQRGPISIGLNANTLQFYRHGITHPWKMFCEPFMLNHGILIVGYGEEKGKPYWTIKNSWGTNWGEQGYFRLYRGKNVCGVQELPTSAIVK